MVNRTKKSNKYGKKTTLVYINNPDMIIDKNKITLQNKCH